ncbi:PepSY domain-containing protein [Salinarimonas sp.]|uniref:PepSY domain-containing protein n=1 Tax=Salinarimonas sp. TaxID=2766526 RepID=UPI0032D99679
MRIAAHIKTSVAALALAAFAVAPATAQDMDLTDEMIMERDPVAEEMIGEGYVGAERAWVRPSEVVAMLRERGYTNIREFDVEFNQYEVEAMSPVGEDVEMDINPYTGEIVKVERNWF